MGEATLAAGFSAVERAGAGGCAVFAWASNRGWGTIFRMGGTCLGGAARAGGCGIAGAGADLSPRRINGWMQVKATKTPQ